jgi:hypothetical protein
LQSFCGSSDGGEASSETPAEKLAALDGADAASFQRYLDSLKTE